MEGADSAKPAPSISYLTPTPTSTTTTTMPPASEAWAAQSPASGNLRGNHLVPAPLSDECQHIFPTSPLHVSSVTRGPLPRFHALDPPAYLGTCRDPPLLYQLRQQRSCNYMNGERVDGLVAQRVKG